MMLVLLAYHIQYLGQQGSHIFTLRAKSSMRARIPFRSALQNGNGARNESYPRAWYLLLSSTQASTESAAAVGPGRMFMLVISRPALAATAFNAATLSSNSVKLL